MKKIINLFYLIAIGLLLTSCYGLDDENFQKLAGITISTESDDVYIKHAEELSLKIDITSEKENKMSYEWAYGTIKSPFPGMIDSTLISKDAILKYTFSRPGEYVLRLKVDNGESIVFKYFKLHVQTGLDEGILILCNDDTGEGSLAFIKKRSAQEEVDNEQEIWSDIMKAVNPDFPLNNTSDLYLSQYKTSSTLLIANRDSQGTIYQLNPSTLELLSVIRMAKEFTGVKPVKFTGEAASSAAYNCYLIGDNKMIYQYDLESNFVALRGDARYVVDHCLEVIYGTSASKRYPVMFNNTQIILPGSSGKTTLMEIESGMKMLNVGMSRSIASKFNFIIQEIDNPLHIKTFNTGTGLTQKKDGANYTSSAPVAMDQNSTMITTRSNQYAYYDYKDKIYRWDVSNITNVGFALPLEENFVKGEDGKSLIPDGEQICAINTMNNPYVLLADPEHLLVATYNPSRSGENKGSLYIFDLATHTLVKKYEGICKKPVKVLYKFRI